MVHMNFVPKPGSVSLTEEQLRHVFLRFDANHDNVLSKNELQNAFSNLGAYFPWYRASRGLHHADADGDGVIDFNELNDLVKYAHKLGYRVK